MLRSRLAEVAVLTTAYRHAVTTQSLSFTDCIATNTMLVDLWYWDFLWHPIALMILVQPFLVQPI